MLSNSSLIFPLEIAKFVFFAVYVAATVGVIVGVYLEGDQFDKETQQRGWRLLVGSLAVDTLFTVLVFGMDGWIASIQRAEIIALERQIAPRDLTSQQQGSIASAIRPFASMHFDLAMSTQLEPIRLMEKIEDALIMGGWLEVPPDPRTTTFNRINKPPVGIRTVAAVWILFSEKSDERFREAAIALVGALRKEGIASQLTETTEKSTTPFDLDKIHVWIGEKP
jgi:hypothetical protein